MARGPKVCATPGCPKFARPGRSFCSDCEGEKDRARGTAAERGYDSRWRAVRAAYLRRHPLCECDACVVLPPEWRWRADDVDHIDGRGPNGPAGYEWSNLRAMAHAHHSRKTVREDGGFGRGRGVG